MDARRTASIALLVTIVSLFLPVRFALACSCASAGSDKKALEESDVVFSGTVVEIDDPEGDGKIISSGRSVFYTFDVDSVAKGEVAGQQVVASAADEASCGYGFRDGRRYLVFADESKNGDVTTYLCSNTREMSEGEDGPFASEEAAESTSGQGEKPTPTPDDGVDIPVAVSVGVAAGLAIIGSALVATRRRRV